MLILIVHIWVSESDGFVCEALSVLPPNSSFSRIIDLFYMKNKIFLIIEK